jgi:DNA-binding CsgD family transcriptional regulator
VLEALGSALALPVVLERAYPALLRLVGADHAAFGYSRTSSPRELGWIATGLPCAFFAGYAQMAAHDFVLSAVLRQPSVVLRDQEMIPRGVLEANPMYVRARELGAPLEQVMAVMLDTGTGGPCGLSVYRDRRRPFSAIERARFQRLVPAIGQTVRNCRRFAAADSWAAALEALLLSQQSAVVLVAPPAIELARSALAAVLIERWFSPHERRPGQLPEPLSAAMKRAASPAADPGAPAASIRETADAILQVSWLSLPSEIPGEARGILVLEERRRVHPLPPAWRGRLTDREQQVSTAVMRGWDNRLIASELGCAEATVKRHLQNIFDKLGVPSRSALVALALRSAGARDIPA